MDEALVFETATVGPVVRGVAVTARAATVLLVAAVAGMSTRPIAAQTTLRVAAYNIRHGSGMDGEVDLERIADVLRPLDADVITLQEVDSGVARTGGVDQAARLGQLLGMRAIFGGFMPYQGGEYGMAVLSRLPVIMSHNHRLPDGAEPRTALEVRVALGGDERPLSVVGIHFYRTAEERLAQAEALSRSLADATHPVILAGDFNSRRGDVVLDRLEQEFSVVSKDRDPLTFPSDRPEREIDFVMVRPAGAFEIVEHRVIDERMASDHRPLLVVLELRELLDGRWR